MFGFAGQGRGGGGALRQHFGWIMRLGIWTSHYDHD